MRHFAEAWAATFSKVGKARHWQEIEIQLSTAAKKDPADGAILLRLASDLRAAAEQTEATVLLTIDQAEELFEEQRSVKAASFLRLLRSALESTQTDLMSIATMRSEFLSAFQTHPVLRERPGGREFYGLISVYPMPQDRFRDVIEEPGRVAGIKIDPALTAEMVKDTATEDALPLLAFTLRRLFENCAGKGEITLEDYARSGKLEGSVKHAIGGLMEFFSVPELKALKQAFIPKLVRVSESGAFVRRLAYRDELPADAKRPIGLLVNNRLLLTDRNSDGRETIEVAHEALFRVWRDLEQWLLEEKDLLMFMERLAHQVSYWVVAGRKRDALLGGSLLEEAERYFAARQEALTPEQQSFIEASRTQLTATQFWDDLELYRDTLSERDLKTLKDLACASVPTKIAFAAMLTSSEACGRKFNRHPGAVTRALAGLDLSLRTIIERDVLVALRGSLERETRQATVCLGIILEAATGELFVEFCRTFAHEQLTSWSMTASADGSLEIETVDARAPLMIFQSAAGSMSPEQVTQTVNIFIDASHSRGHWLPLFRVMARMCTSSQVTEVLTAHVDELSNPQDVLSLIQDLDLQPSAKKEWERKIVDRFLMAGHFGFGYLPGLQFELTGEQAERLLGSITSGEWMTMMHSGVEALFQMLPTRAVPGAIDAILATIEVTNDNAFEVDRLKKLGICLQTTARKVRADEAHALFERFLSTMEQHENPAALQVLADGIAALALELTSEDGQRAMRPLLRALQTAPSEEYDPLISGLDAIWRKITSGQAQQALEPLRVAIRTTADANLTLILISKMSVLADGISSRRARELIEPFLERLKLQEFSGHDAFLIRCHLKSVGSKLDPTDAQEICETLLHAISKTSDIDVIASMLEGVNVLTVEMTDAQVIGVLDLVLAVARRKRSPGALDRISGCIDALSRKLSSVQAEQKIANLLPVIRGNASPQVLHAAGMLFHALLSVLGSDEAHRVGQNVRSALPRKRTPAGLAVMAQGLRILSEKIQPQHSKEISTVTDHILGALATSNSQESTILLANSLKELGHEFADRQFVEAIFEALKHPTVAGKATLVLLDALRARFPTEKELADGLLWRAVDWAEHKFDGLKLRRPPSKVTAATGGSARFRQRAG